MYLEDNKLTAPDQTRRFHTRVVAQHRLSETGYELILERDGLEFKAGRLIMIHGRNVTEDRSYTVASGENDEHLHVLYRYIPTGKLTPQLINLKPGNTLEVSGPYGEFIIRDPARPLLFIATGTGVAPCRAYIRTHRDLDLTLIHGARVLDDLFYRHEFAPYKYHPCITQENGEAYRGRVTEFLKESKIDINSHAYLCGAYEMIYDVQDLLVERGMPAEHIFMEGYYYRLDM